MIGFTSRARGLSALLVAVLLVAGVVAAAGFGALPFGAGEDTAARTSAEDPAQRTPRPTPAGARTDASPSPSSPSSPSSADPRSDLAAAAEDWALEHTPMPQPGYRIEKLPQLSIRYQPDREVWQAAQPAYEENPTNPLAGRRWGVYQGPLEAVWGPYEASGGEERALLGKIALRPKATWIGDWTASPEEIGDVVREYVANASGGDPDVLVQLSIFRMVPWEHPSCDRAASPGEADAYRRWISNAAAALGEQPAAIILQPDLPFWWCSPNRELTSELIRHAVSAFEAQPNTDVYLDAGDADWSSVPQMGVPRPEQAADLLIANGIADAHGFALGATHYVGTPERIAYGARLVEILADRGIPGKRFVVDTGQNGNGMEWPEVTPVDGNINDNARVCQSVSDRAGCVTLGIPPTAMVADPRWGLPEHLAALAREHVDGYLWFSRSWLRMQADWVGPERGLDMARSTPWPGPPA